ncbi:MAG TPA: YoaK family protein [Rhizomicrobium sp.]|jgi:uncharacterized membrane protein YoaK (UPF0700 family)|nr:YoaK family protein [Rhizomicrobium sp.]
MTRFDRRVRLLAAFLSALAGYVDAIGFLKLGGFFVSFMSGNSTRLAVALAQGSWQAVEGAGLIGSFVAGVIVGAFIGHIAKGHRRLAVLLVVATLLALAAALNRMGIVPAAIAAMALAMGAENAVFERDGEVQIGLTYMTGTLVKMGRGIAAALLGGAPFAWLPYLLLWFGLICGAVLGAVAYPYLGLDGLWPAAAYAAACAVVAARLERDEPQIAS